MELLEKQNIRLRALEPEDLELMYQWENSSELWQYGNTHLPYSKYHLKQFIENTTNDLYTDKQVRFMIDLQLNDGPSKTIGAIDIFDFDAFHQRAGLGVLIADKTERGNGYATIALDIVINYVFHYLRLHQLHCTITVDNKKSLNLFTSAGFIITGTYKDWIRTDDSFLDEHFLQLLNFDIK